MGRVVTAISAVAFIILNFTLGRNLKICKR